MDDKSGDLLEEKSSDFATRLRRLIPYLMAGTGLVFIILGFLINHIKSDQNTSLGSTDSKKTGSVAGEIKTKTIVVDISGAVEQPGVYTMPYDSRIDNVLITAGGLAPKADRKYISRYINLAQRVIDGMKIYIPFENDNFISQSSQEAGGVVKVSRLININLASSSELDSLPGIGTVTAGKIIAGRPYQNITELTSRSIVTKSVFDKIKDKISTN